MYITFVKGIVDGTEAREVIKAEDIISAKAIMHKRIGGAMDDKNCAFAFATVMNSRGQLLCGDSFERPKPIPQELLDAE